ncbi:MAG: CD225/dispanin family protein [Chitinophagaceae bacterium]|nr:CD225/dispanin family protein [Chitinophagaceae bacterium]
MASIPGTIFINYRKDDSSWNALALYNELQKYFTKEQIFKDFNTILPGDDFVVSIDNALRKCDVLIVVVGKNWLQIKDVAGKRRLDDADDFVRLEIATALARGIQVIPVLFDDVPMPRPDELPDDMKALCRRQFIEIDSKRFDDDVRNLAEAIKKVLPDGVIRVTPGQRETAHSSQPYNAGAGTGSNPPPMQKPDNNLVWAILSTILCCLPLGIVAIISATKVDNLWNSGQHSEAVREAKKAKDWAIYSAIAGVVVIILYFIIAVGSGSY